MVIHWMGENKRKRATEGKKKKSSSFQKDQQKREYAWKDLVATDTITEYILILRNFLAVFFFLFIEYIKKQWLTSNPVH